MQLRLQLIALLPALVLAQPALAGQTSTEAAAPAAPRSVASEAGAPAEARLDDESLLGDLSERTFRFFWETANPENGLVPDRWPSPAPSSIAAVGFALTAYPIGVERGYITREQARERTLATLRFFHDAPQGPEPEGKSGLMFFL